MPKYATAVWRILRSEWRYTYRSARREWSRRDAARKFFREVGKGMLQVPAYARELRRA